MLTDAELDRLCGQPSMTFEERLAADFRSLEIRERYTGSVAPI